MSDATLAERGTGTEVERVGGRKQDDDLTSGRIPATARAQVPAA